MREIIEIRAKNDKLYKKKFKNYKIDGFLAQNTH